MAEVVTVLDLADEHDVFEARQAARTIARSLGFRRVDQARLATAVSEIARRATHDAGGGDASFALQHDGRARLLITVRATAELPVANGSREHRPRGLVMAGRLVDVFAIERDDDGTVVTLGRDLPGEPGRDQLWDLARSCRRTLAGLVPSDPRDELRRQHRELLVALDEQARAEAEAHASQERLRLAVDTAGIGILEVDPLSHEVHGCQNAGVLLGGPGLYDLDSLLERIAERDRATVRAVLAGPIQETADVELRTINGRWLRLRMRPLDGDDTSLRVGALLDVTTSVRREDEIRQRLKLEEQLIGIVSHDLRTPLGVILMGAEALKGSNLGAHQRSILRRVERSGERCLRLVSDLLDFTRARLGTGIPIAPREVDLHEIAAELVASIELSHPGRSVVFHRLGDGRGVWDGERLEQALTNLVENALSYGPRDEPATLTVDGRHRDMLVQVHNGGEPIPTELLPRLFEPLQRGPQSSGCGGRSIGLGLFIVSQIVSGHGGSVSVRSSPSGTTVEVRLPRRPNLLSRQPANDAHA